MERHKFMRNTRGIADDNELGGKRPLLDTREEYIPHIEM
jgi:hypothetical protein